MIKGKPPFTEEPWNWVEYGIGYWTIKEDCPEHLRKQIERIFKDYGLKDTRGQNAKVF